MKAWNECVGGSGPDHILSIWFSRSHENLLRQTIRGIRLHGFNRFTLKRNGYLWTQVNEASEGSSDWYPDVTVARGTSSESLKTLLKLG